MKKSRPSPGLCTLEAHVDNEKAPKTPEGSVPPFLTYGAKRNAAADTLKAALEKVTAK